MLRKLSPYFLVTLFAAIYLWPFTRILEEAVDEGTFQYGAQLVARGAVPFRDFTEPAGPGSFYWLAFCFRLFGIGFGTSRTVPLLTAVAVTLLVFHLSRRIDASGHFAAAFVSIMRMPSTIMNSPDYDSNVLVLSGFGVFLSGERRINYEESPAARRLAFCSSRES
jgi:hypothetical protein